MRHDFNEIGLVNELEEDIPIQPAQRLIDDVNAKLLTQEEINYMYKEIRELV